MMEGKRRMVHNDEVGEIKKGPWKAEEDEVLINHVKKYGPRDWSSIRSKGLLRRTGKSCRLRWVNKLRPHLKTGMKFSTEEERTVIDLQAQFGNKWARIATYLPGRTDNDVKNFWSSRQKRLARILQTSSSTPSSSKPQKNAEEIQAPILHDVLSIEAPKFSSSTEEELSSRVDDYLAIKQVPFDNQIYPSSVIQDNSPFQLNYNDYVPPEKKPLSHEIPQTHLSFPQIPQLQQEFPMPLESQDYIDANLGEPSFLDEFEHASGSALGTAQVPIVPMFSGQDATSGQRVESHDAVDLDSFINDFPSIDVFDNIGSLPSPSQWP